MMEAALVVLFGGAMLGAAILARRQRLRDWENAVTMHGLQVLETSSFPGLEVRASAGPVEVRIETHGNKGRLTRIVVLAPVPPDFQNVSIRPQKPFHIGREIEVGDAWFDSELFVEGPAQLLLALLDPETRLLLTTLRNESQLEISSGELRAVLSSEEKVPGVLARLLDLRKRFAPPVEIGRRMAENATQDPEPGVRLKNLRLLILARPDDPETAGALRKAVSDPVPQIRLEAARELGAEGRPLLLELAEGQVDDALSAEAVSALERELPFERATAILDRALSRRRLRTARACLETIGRSGHAAAVDVLAKVLEQEYGELAPVAAHALGETGSPAAEPLLVAALQREEDDDVRMAAADALGRIGSVAAVLPLRELADRYLLGDVRKAARQAIVQIQSRAAGASPGQLSLAGAEAGQLSLADDPAGQLSLSGDEKSPGSEVIPTWNQSSSS